MFEHIKAEDPEVFQAITQEVERQRNKIEIGRASCRERV